MKKPKAATRVRVRKKKVSPVVDVGAGGKRVRGVSTISAKRRASAVLTAISSPEATRRIELVEQIRAGFPYEMVESMTLEVGITVDELVEVGVITRRTLSHSRQAQQFSSAQSDRATRFFRIFQKAKDTFGSKEKAIAWLRRPTRPLAENAPVTLLDTEEGARMVDDLLSRIDHGIAA
jgi:putative toxin-antitoxin system antitoxin component (TIGR02293 family)